MQMDLSMQAPILLLWLFPPVVLAASGGCSSFRNDTTVERIMTLSWSRYLKTVSHTSLKLHCIVCKVAY